jgi:hypothetical protein
MQVYLPAVLLILLAVWGGWMRKKGKFKPPPEPTWPMAENPGLALELADSNQFVNAVLGDAGTALGDENRTTAALLQKLDFVFIPLYALFFAVAAMVRAGAGDDSLRAVPAIGCAFLAAIFDVFENLQILRMIAPAPHSSARRFGQGKWLFYFLTVAAEGILFLPHGTGESARSLAGGLFGIFLIATAAGGVISSLKGSFTGILSATQVSIAGLIGLAAAPWIAAAPFSWRMVAVYGVVMRVPILIGVLLVALPFIAFFTGARSLLRGLFDLTPWSLFAVTLTSLAVAGTACMNASIVLHHASQRFGVERIPRDSLPGEHAWVNIMICLALPVIGFGIGFSARQGHGLLRLLLAVIGAGAVAVATAWRVIRWGPDFSVSVLPWLARENLAPRLAGSTIFAGYAHLDATKGLARDHLTAVTAFLSTLVLYILLGVYGYWKLGKRRTVPALCSALMLVMMVGWMLSATAFFFDEWRIPVVLIVVAAGALTAQSNRSDHFYQLRARVSKVPASQPAELISATKQPRVIVVAANGGGIQAGAWAAQVLQGLFEDSGDIFADSLRLISSVSGGSVGSACFLHWLANRDNARTPAEAAADSSLDEVAWGLAWTDFVRGLAPWLFGWMMGRGRALEEAWKMNSAQDRGGRGEMDEPLSSWNEKAARGELPAAVMNATIAETGERLLLATTSRGVGRRLTDRACVDATELHTINDQKLDVGVVTAARMSASFPYVTPASRSDGPGPQPHVVDGGYYDNYGMATVVEWLDEALTGVKSIEGVLVIQIHGAPVDTNQRDERHAQNRGWFYQAIAPLTTLAAVRSSGQIAHNDIELELLQQKWSAAGIPIHTVTFEFHNPNAPLSWHLTPQEVAEIREAWRLDMSTCRRCVKQFLAGSEDLDCGCPQCIHRTPAA